MNDKDLIFSLEEKLDKEFSDHPLMKGEFLKEYIRLSGILSYRLACEGSIPVDCVQIFYAIFNNLHNFNEVDFGSVFPAFVGEGANDFNYLLQCASLHLTFPQLHKKILKINGDNGLYFVDYVNDEAKNIEVQDSILTNASLPGVGGIHVGNKEISAYFIDKINNNENINLYDIFDYLKEISLSYKDSFIEQPLIQDEGYQEIGFSSKDAFLKIRSALIAVANVVNFGFYICHCIYLRDQSDTYIQNYMFDNFSVINLNQNYFDEIILKLSGVGFEDLKCFKKYFYYSPRYAARKKIDREFLPPVYEVGDNVYFSSALLPMLLSTRNLLIKLQESDEGTFEKQLFDEQISKRFEPTLVERAEKYFLEAGCVVKKEIPYNGGSFDMIIFSPKDNIVLTVQAKATLYPESARSVDRLVDRLTNKKDGAVSQVLKFDNFSSEYKFEIFNREFPGLDLNNKPLHLRSILTNSSFGSYKSWSEIYKNKIIPINCNILNNTLGKGKSLGSLSFEVDMYIKGLVERHEVIWDEIDFKLKSFQMKQVRFQTKDCAKELHNLGIQGG